MNVHKSVLAINALFVKKLLVNFLREEVVKAGFSKGVIGASGGVDSSVALFLTAEALGKENVLAVILPYRTSDISSEVDAMTVIQMLGVKSEKIDITQMVDAYLEHYQITENVRRGNVMARQRMIVLYDISARERALVIGTSNKTELLLGYGTLYGDTACAINPLGDLYKTQIWQLAETLGVPKNIIEKKPSADLWQGQTDEDELGFLYREVDQLLYYMIDEGRSDEELFEIGFEKHFINKVKQIMQRNQFKQRLPIIAKISHNE